jgi:hypothetical protein
VGPVVFLSSSSFLRLLAMPNIFFGRLECADANGDGDRIPSS